jgi:hypothetical protein
LRFFLPALLFTAASLAQQPTSRAPVLPDAPSQFLRPAAESELPILPLADDPDSSVLDASRVELAVAGFGAFSSSLAPAALYDFSFDPPGRQQDPAQTARQSDQSKKKPQPQEQDLDLQGNPIPLDRHQPKRILGFMPNYRTVSAGARVHPPGWKYNFHVATRQAFDYSSFLFLGLTSLTAEAIDSHPALGKGADGFYAYTWRGFLDKTDGTYLSAFLLPSLLHEDTRYYPLGNGHSIPVRALYVISRQGVARTYGGRQTPNLAGLGGKVLTQVISRYYYPPSAGDFSVLATKFAYSAMRDIAFSSIREFYPDIAAHYVRKHREKVAAQASPTKP